MSVRILWTAVWAVLLVAASSACSFDLSEHPRTCKTSGDCSSGRYCYEHFCVLGSVSTTGGSGGAASGHSGQNSGGSSGTGGHAGQSGTHGGGGNGGSNAAADGGPSGGDAAVPDATVVTDAGADAGTTPQVPPYASCSNGGSCNPGEVCRKNVGNAVCSAPCTKNDDCSLPTGGAATRLCDTSLCRLDCSPKSVPPFPRTCPAGMTCIGESGKFTCYPQ